MLSGVAGAAEGAAAGVHPALPLADELTEDEVAEVLAAFCDSFASRRVVSRQLGYHGVQSLLRELKRNPSIATVIAKNDFPYFDCDSGKRVIEREYWLRVSRASLSDKSLVRRDDFIILHVHYYIRAIGICPTTRPRSTENGSNCISFPHLSAGALLHLCISARRASWPDQA